MKCRRPGYGKVVTCDWGACVRPRRASAGDSVPRAPPPLHLPPRPLRTDTKSYTTVVFSNDNRASTVLIHAIVRQTIYFTFNRTIMNQWYPNALPIGFLITIDHNYEEVLNVNVREFAFTINLSNYDSFIVKKKFYSLKTLIHYYCYILFSFIDIWYLNKLFLHNLSVR